MPGNNDQECNFKFKILYCDSDLCLVQVQQDEEYETFSYNYIAYFEEGMYKFEHENKKYSFEIQKKVYEY